MSSTFEDYRGHAPPQHRQQALRYAEKEFAQLAKTQQESKLEQLGRLQQQHEELAALLQAQRELAEEDQQEYYQNLDKHQHSTRFIGSMKPDLKQPLPPKSTKDLRIFKHLTQPKQSPLDYDPNQPFNKSQPQHYRATGANNVNQMSGREDEVELMPDDYTLIATMAEARSTGEINHYYKRVVDLFRKSYPTTYVPELHLKIEPKEDRPFFQMSLGVEAFLSPLILGTSGRALRRIFVKATPSFIESEQRLIDSTDNFYHTPERIQFVLAKALCESSLNLNGGWNWLRVNFWRYLSTKKFNLLREQKEMKSDTMAAHLSADIAIGGIEHVAKLNSYYEYFQHDITDSDEAVSADVRLMNLLNVAESACLVYLSSRWFPSTALRISLTSLILCPFLTHP